MRGFARIENDWLAVPEDEAEAVSQCCVCTEAIVVGDSYWETAGGDICCICLEGMTAADFLCEVCCVEQNIAIKD